MGVLNGVICAVLYLSCYHSIHNNPLNVILSHNFLKDHMLMLDVRRWGTCKISTVINV